MKLDNLKHLPDVDVGRATVDGGAAVELAQVEWKDWNVRRGLYVVGVDRNAELLICSNVVDLAGRVDAKIVLPYRVKNITRYETVKKLS